MVGMDEEGQKSKVAWCCVGNTENTGNFVLDPRFNWKPVECSKQLCSALMPGLTEDYSGNMILYALKFIQFVVRETSK